MSSVPTNRVVAISYEKSEDTANGVSNHASYITTSSDKELPSKVIDSPDSNYTGSKGDTPSGGNTGKIQADDVTDCGYGTCRPTALQCFNNPKAFICWLSWYTFVQGFVINGVNNLNTTTIEKRFNMASSKVGLISSIYDISAGIFVLPMTVYGTLGHQPRLLALSAFCMCIGSFIMALPHFTTDLYNLGDPIAEYCEPSINGTLKDCEGNNLSNYLYVFLLGQFLNGIGGTTLYTLGFVYIDSNVSTKSSPMYQGIMLMFSSLGPAVGYVFGGYMLSYYVDFDQVDVSTVSIDGDDLRWVGAWWVSFLIASGLFITVIIALYPYPKLMPAGIKAQSSRISQAHNDGSESVVNRDDFLHSWSDVIISFRFLLTNPVMIFLTCGLITEGMVLSGFSTFLPKIIQNQFIQTATWAALLAGFIVVPAAATGNLASSLIMRCLKMKVAGMLKLTITVCVLFMLSGIIILVRCNNANLAGVVLPYSGYSDVSLNATCNINCGCTTESYEPVCGLDEVQYFSPCHAGCMVSFLQGDSKMYNNCSCIASKLGEFGEQAVEGVCDPNCNKMTLFLVMFVIVIFVGFMVNVPTISITLRCLPDKQRLIGMGVQAVFVRFLGTFSGPLLFGSVFDDACIQWQEVCGSRGVCWVYDNVKLSYSLLTLILVLKFFSALFFSLTHYFYKPPYENP